MHKRWGQRSCLIEHLLCRYGDKGRCVCKKERQVKRREGWAAEYAVFDGVCAPKDTGTLVFVIVT